MRVRIKDNVGFDNVFGADCFRRNFPELLTMEGVEVRRMFTDKFYYIINPATGWYYDSSCFFTKEDMQYLMFIRKRSMPVCEFCGNPTGGPSPCCNEGAL